jgi:hypothetical protein
MFALGAPSADDVCQLVLAAAAKIAELEREKLPSAEEQTRFDILMQLPWVKEAVDEAIQATVRNAKQQNQIILGPKASAPWKVTT